MQIDIALIDWPAKFRVRSDKGEGRTAEHHYSTSPLVQTFGDLPLKEVMAKDGLVFSWTTIPHLPETMQLMDKLGFTYVTVAFVWEKLIQNYEQYWMKILREGQKYMTLGMRPPIEKWINGMFHMGLGFTTRANIEMILLYRMPRGATNRSSKSVRQLQLLPDTSEEQDLGIETETILWPIDRRREIGHSAKPAIFNNRITELCGQRAVQVEFFARRSIPGWRSTGLESDGLLIHDAIERIRRDEVPFAENIQLPDQHQSSL